MQVFSIQWHCWDEIRSIRFLNGIAAKPFKIKSIYFYRFPKDVVWIGGEKTSGTFGRVREPGGKWRYSVTNWQHGEIFGNLTGVKKELDHLIYSKSSFRPDLCSPCSHKVLDLGPGQLQSLCLCNITRQNPSVLDTTVTIRLLNGSNNRPGYFKDESPSAADSNLGTDKSRVGSAKCRLLLAMPYVLKLFQFKRSWGRQPRQTKNKLLAKNGFKNILELRDIWS